MSQASWIAYRKAKPRATLRLFCFPYAGGGTSIFRSWDKLLPETIELCSIQLPGREARAMEAAYSRIEPLVEALSSGIRPFLDLPYGFFGYSMGALIAFELARRPNAETAAGLLHLFVAARPGPRLPDPYPRTEHLSDGDFIKQLKTIGGTSKEILENPEMLKFVLPMLRADFALCENYKYNHGPRLDCPLTVFGGSGDEGTSKEKLAAWCAESNGPGKVNMLDGDHFFIHTCQAELVQSIAQAMLAGAPISNSFS